MNWSVRNMNGIDSIGSKRRWFCLIITSIALWSGATSLAAATLELKVVNDNSAPIPCRVLLLSEDGNSVLPKDHAVLRVGPQQWFVINGAETINLPTGRYLLRVERGMQYTRYKKDIQIKSQGLKLQVELSQWADMKSRGYAIGENHSHVPSAILGPLLAAEDLDFGSSLTWWNGERENMPVPQGPAHQRPMTYANSTVTSSVFDAEIEHPWGAVYIQNLPKPLPFASEPGRPNLDALKHAKEVGATVHYQAGWSREVGLDALLGYVDIVNVCNNNFHPHQYQLRSRYSNLLETPALEIYPNTDVGMMRMNTETYYRLLNWGLKLAAGAGSACGVKPAPLGYNRAYVRMNENTDPNAIWNLDDFYTNWKAGRNFVTNGPLIFLQTDQNQKPGDTIAFGKNGGNVKLQVEVMSRQALTAVEIIVNGKVVHTFDLKDENVFAGEFEIQLQKGSWIAARCTSRDAWLTDQQNAVFRVGKDDSPFPTRPSRLRFAHTSPVYVTVAGRGAVEITSVQEGLRMMDRMESFTQEHADAQYVAPTLKAIVKARHILQNKLIRD